MLFAAYLHALKRKVLLKLQSLSAYLLSFPGNEIAYGFTEEAGQ